MSAKTVTGFFTQFQNFELELTNKLKELRDSAERENPAILRRPIKLTWLDELEHLQESIMTQMEFCRSANRLDVLVSASESCADTLEAALTRAEDLASLRYDYVPPEPDRIPPALNHAEKQQHQQQENDFQSSLALNNKRLIAERRFSPKGSPLRSNAGIKTPKRSWKTPKASRTLALDEPPTPRLEDLGLSSLAMNRIRRRG